MSCQFQSLAANLRVLRVWEPEEKLDSIYRSMAILLLLYRSPHACCKSQIANRKGGERLQGRYCSENAVSTHGVSCTSGMQNAGAHRIIMLRSEVVNSRAKDRQTSCPCCAQCPATNRLVSVSLRHFFFFFGSELWSFISPSIHSLCPSHGVKTFFSPFFVVKRSSPNVERTLFICSSVHIRLLLTFFACLLVLTDSLISTILVGLSMT